MRMMCANNDRYGWLFAVTIWWQLVELRAGEKCQDYECTDGTYCCGNFSCCQGYSFDFFGTVLVILGLLIVVSCCCVLCTYFCKCGKRRRSPLSGTGQPPCSAISMQDSNSNSASQRNCNRHTPDVDSCPVYHIVVEDQPIRSATSASQLNATAAAAAAAAVNANRAVTYAHQRDNSGLTSLNEPRFLDELPSYDVAVAYKNKN